jgi:hypothetical protein
MVVGLVALLAVSGVDAAEITLKVSEADQAALGMLPGAVDACVAGLQLRGDAQMCKAIATFATDFVAKVRAAAPAAEPEKK